MNCLVRFGVSCAALLLVGCGPQWEGHYSGDLDWGIMTCSDGSTAGAEPFGSVSMDIYDGDSGTIDIHITDFGCGPFSAKLEGNRAVLQLEKCEPIFYQGYTWQETFTSGTLTRVEQDLHVKANYRLEFGPTGGLVEGHCTSSLTGKLWRPD